MPTASQKLAGGRDSRLREAIPPVRLSNNLDPSGVAARMAVAVALNRWDAYGILGKAWIGHPLFSFLGL
ncbi:MAG: hypothetical protein SFY80_17055 [Verrucomicrobiota bacterium]|nr:hypothetical protein [Verrucomicrobiota bacterium]